MKLRHTEPLIIGRDWHASRAVTIAIHNRAVIQRRRYAARMSRRIVIDRILEALAFWKP